MLPGRIGDVHHAVWKSLSCSAHLGSAQSHFWSVAVNLPNAPTLVSIQSRDRPAKQVRTVNAG